MSGSLIALNESPFWLMCALAVAVLVPLTGASARKCALAGLNLGFLAILLRWDALGLIAALLVAHMLLREAGRPPIRGWAASALGLATLGLFVLHKRPPESYQLGLAAPARVLSLVGFSYVALRMTEVLRAVWEGRHRAPDLPALLNYLLPFHMLAAGPIQAYEDFARQSADPGQPSVRRVLAGVERIASGVFKKFVLAFILQKLFLTDFRANGLYFLIEMQVFYVWLFLDFSAYSDIAVGVGALIGVPTPENFNRPFLARNMIDFWERWHISFYQFIRRNLFMPIQIALMRWTDARRPLLCAVAAISISLVFSGLWHGLNLRFLAWGGMHATGLVAAFVYGHVLKKMLGTKGLKAYRANPWIRCLSTAVTFEFVACSLLILVLPFGSP
jgi:D-alanyl-lipoteichoic acid acyltransferase DltB (MBOAT superfamily)